jgi:hypothetical protein
VFVAMADGSVKVAGEVEVGDRVRSPNADGGAAQVEATWQWEWEGPSSGTEIVWLPAAASATATAAASPVAATDDGSSVAEAAHEHGFWITHKHPVKVLGKWVHPKDLGPARPATPPSLLLCNFVLSAGHSLVVVAGGVGSGSSGGGGGAKVKAAVAAMEVVTMGGGSANPTTGTAVDNTYYTASGDGSSTSRSSNSNGSGGSMGIVTLLRAHPTYPAVHGRIGANALVQSNNVDVSPTDTSSLQGRARASITTSALASAMITAC